MRADFVRLFVRLLWDSIYQWKVHWTHKCLYLEHAQSLCFWDHSENTGVQWSSSAPLLKIRYSKKGTWGIFFFSFLLLSIIILLLFTLKFVSRVFFVSPSRFPLESEKCAEPHEILSTSIIIVTNFLIKWSNIGSSIVNLVKIGLEVNELLHMTERRSKWATFSLILSILLLKVL